MARIYKVTSYIVDMSNNNRDITNSIECYSTDSETMDGNTKIEKSAEFAWTDEHPLNLVSATAEDYEKWFKTNNLEKCEYYEIRERQLPRYDTYTGRIAYYQDEEYGVCLGTKECDECGCLGFKKFCSRRKW